MKIPGTGMAVAIDLGEDNDLHPLNKEGVGYRLAMQAAAVLYGAGKECSGPQICGIEMGCEGPRICAAEPACGSRQVRLRFRNAAGMYAHSENKGMEIVEHRWCEGDGDQ